MVHDCSAFSFHFSEGEPVDELSLMHTLQLVSESPRHRIGQMLSFTEPFRTGAVTENAGEACRVVLAA